MFVRKMKVIDTFPFNGDWIIRMRLEFLSPFVDEFIITESRYTFSGMKKDFLFKDKWASILKEYQSKIHWIIIDEYMEPTKEWLETYEKQPWFRPENAKCWYNEHYQRDVAVAYIQEKNKNTQYIVNVGDVDEMPNTDIFHPNVRDTMYKKLTEMKEPLFLEMYFFYYNFYWKKPYNWYRAYIIASDQLEKNNNSLNYWRLLFRPNFVLRTAGWHFSYFMEPSDIQRKIKSFSHQEYNQYCWINKEHIKECIALGKDIFQRDEDELLVANETIQFPEVISAYRGEIDYLQLC